MAPRAIISSRWQDLAMVTFEAGPDLVRPHVPRSLEPDTWNGRHLVTLVGLRVSEQAVAGIPIPFSGGLLQLNLRTYVRRRIGPDWRPGVVFIRQVVSQRTAALFARLLYGLSCVAMPMERQSGRDPDGGETLEYRWRVEGRWNSLRLAPCGELRRPGPLEEFVVERYWGYVPRAEGSCAEFRVVHPPWEIRSANAVRLDCDVGRVYGRAFEQCLRAEPCSAFVAAGSRAFVYTAARL